MSSARRLHHSYEEYLRALELSGVKLADGWCERELRAGERLLVDVPELSLSVDELYAGIELSTE